ncbi:MAG: hypothetical protein EA357_06515 [Micavibrio sp.]|nr:MAG: hypothetical protein EA357_06515 [Micavibrio sp.]
MKKYTLFLAAAFLCFAFPAKDAAAQNSCYAVLPQDVRSVDLNGDDMWLALEGYAYAAFLSYSAVHSEHCVSIGENSFSVRGIEEGGLSLLSLPRPEIEEFRQIIASLL